MLFRSLFAAIPPKEFTRTVGRKPLKWQHFHQIWSSIAGIGGISPVQPDRDHRLDAFFLTHRAKVAGRRRRKQSPVFACNAPDSWFRAADSLARDLALLPVT
jgi:hypothetical protein